MLAREISRLVIGNGAFMQGTVDANLVVAADVDIGLVCDGSVLADPAYAVKRVDINNIFIAQVIRVLVCKLVILAGNGKVADAVAGQDRDLHPVVVDVQPSAAL